MDSYVRHAIECPGGKRNYHSRVPFPFNIDLDPNEVIENLIFETQSARNLVFPAKKVTRKNAELMQTPWLTDEIIKEGKLRDELQKKAVLSGLIQDHENYKKTEK